MELFNFSGGGQGVIGRLRGRNVIVARPNGKAYGHLALEIAMTLGLAREAGVDVYFVPPAGAANPALFDLDAEGVRILRPHGLRELSLRQVLRRRAFARSVSAVWHKYETEVWSLVERELAKHAANPDRPKGLRDRLRKAHHRVGTDARTGHRPDPVLYYRRRLLREPVPVRLRPVMAETTTRAAEALGISRDAHVVAVHARTPGFKSGWDIQDIKTGGRDESFRNAQLESYFDALDFLVDEGYTVVRIGDSSMDPVSRPGVVDLATSPLRTPALELHILLRSAFLISGDSGPHLVSYLTNTPLLMVNATDPILVYPVRRTGRYLLKTVIDLDTGRPVSLPELLTDEYYGALRSPARYGYRPNTSHEILSAVQEMVSELRSPGPETDAQSLYRQTVADACASLKNKFVRKWASDDGFLGDGRAVRFYADRWF